MVWNVSNATTVELNNMTLSLTSVKFTTFQLGSVATAGTGITALGATAPSGLLALTIGGWVKVTLSNGSTAYVPVWF